jgi:hypothetical protein
MEDALQKLVRELRNERCPDAVLDRVAQQISRDTRVPRPWQRPAMWVTASVLLLAVLTVWHWLPSRDTKIKTAQITTAALTEADRTLVIQRTQGVLVYIGHTMIEAAAHTENAILSEAVPPLRNGFLTAKNKVTNSI